MANQLINKNRLLCILLLATGVGVGLLFSSLQAFFRPDSTNRSVAAQTVSPAPANEIISAAAEEVTPDVKQQTGAQAPETEIETAPASDITAIISADPSILVGHLIRQLEEEKLARQALQQAIDNLKNDLQTLAQRFDKLESAKQNNRGRRQAQNERRRIDRATLVEAGFELSDAELIAQQWNQQELDMLYLRDQAAREGWLDTPEFRQAAQEIRQDLDSLWQDLDDSAYDRFLYATGRPNRVRIDNVIDSSPGQSIGLQAGDIVLNYGGSPIYSGQDLQSATTSGEPDEPVIMQIIRDDALIELEIPRGPIGISMTPLSIPPQMANNLFQTDS